MTQAPTDLHGGHHAELVSLDRPCTYCKVLELDDRKQGGKIQIAANGKAYVDFGTIQQNLEKRAAEKGESSIALARDLSALIDFRAEWSGSFEKPEEGPMTHLKLEYQRTDALPSLPALATTASEGCAFCQVLRQDLITAWGSINKKRETEAELGICEVVYEFEKFNTSSEPDPKIWLDALYVLFTIRSPGISREYYLHYNIHTEPEGKVI